MLPSLTRDAQARPSPLFQRRPPEMLVETFVVGAVEFERRGVGEGGRLREAADEQEGDGGRRRETEGEGEDAGALRK